MRLAIGPAEALLWPDYDLGDLITKPAKTNGTPYRPRGDGAGGLGAIDERWGRIWQTNHKRATEFIFAIWVETVMLLLAITQ